MPQKTVKFNPRSPKDMERYETTKNMNFGRGVKEWLDSLKGKDPAIEALERKVAELERRIQGGVTIKPQEKPPERKKGVGSNFV
jgi:hypothetical protein